MSRTKDKIKLEYFEMPTVGGSPIVESGSNSDGEWTRWADGTQVCINTINGGSSIALGSGTYNVPYSTASFVWTYPVQFIAFAKVTGNCYSSLNNNEASVLNLGNNVGDSVSTSNMRLVKCGSGTSSGSRSVAIKAHGRWK